MKGKNQKATWQALRANHRGPTMPTKRAKASSIRQRALSHPRSSRRPTPPSAFKPLTPASPAARFLYTATNCPASLAAAHVARGVGTPGRCLPRTCLVRLGYAADSHKAVTGRSHPCRLTPPLARTPRPPQNNHSFSLSVANLSNEGFRTGIFLWYKPWSQLWMC